MKKILFMVLSLGLLQGCAFTDTTINRDFTHDASVTSGTTLANKVNIRDVEDKRGLQGGTYIMNKKNGYGMTTSGEYHTETQISEILENLLNDAVQQVSIDANGQDLYLDAAIEELDTNTKSGFSKVSLDVEVDVEYSLYDKQGNELWADDVKGYYTGTSAMMLSKDKISETLNFALSNSIDNLAKDKDFRKAVNDAYQR